MKHWPTMLLGIIVAAIFLVAVFSFQVNEKETVVVTTLGRIEGADYGPGLHFRWPYPIQEIFKFDHRYRCFSGIIGENEETMTQDSKNIIVGMFINYRIADAKEFYRKLETVRSGEEIINSWMRGYTMETFGRYDFDELINTDPKEMRLEKIQQEILEKLRARAAPYGLKISSVGIKALNIPEDITKKVFERMKQERNVVAAKYLAEGNKRARQIEIATDSKKQFILTEAEAKAKEIRAQGDAEAAQYYAIFKESPELAAFLRKLESLRKIMNSKTTLILDTDSAPFDIFKINAEQLTQPVIKK